LYIETDEERRESKNCLSRKISSLAKKLENCRRLRVKNKENSEPESIIDYDLVQLYQKG
jgi:hypothetical protein